METVGLVQSQAHLSNNAVIKSTPVLYQQPWTGIPAVRIGARMIVPISDARPLALKDCAAKFLSTMDWSEVVRSNSGVTPDQRRKACDIV